MSAAVPAAGAALGPPGRGTVTKDPVSRRQTACKLMCMSGSAGSRSATGGNIELTERVSRLEIQLALLTEAVEVLARGLESTPVAEPRNRPAEEAARRAHELLLVAKTAKPGGSGEGGTGS